MPDVTEDWIVRLRMKLGIAKVNPEISGYKPKPPEPDLPLAKLSTGTIAGSMERIAVYRLRAERGEAIFHPLDNRDIAIR